MLSESAINFGRHQGLEVGIWTGEEGMEEVYEVAGEGFDFIDGILVVMYKIDFHSVNRLF